MVQVININKIKANRDNPRIIKDEKFQKLVRSIQEFPEMLYLRPIVVNQDMVILGGNMRHKAAKEAGLKEIPIIVADNLDEAKEREFIIKDNVGFGEWDWDALANLWDVEELDLWGLDLPLDFVEPENIDNDVDKLTKKLTLEYTIDEADRIESELLKIAPTMEAALIVLLSK